MKVAFYTLGCKVNQYETESLRELFILRGDEVVSEDASADVYIINSCTVTAESDRKTGQAVRRFRKQSPNAAIVLTGCMPQAYPEKAVTLPADVIAGNTDVSEIPVLLDRFFKTGEQVICIKNHKRKEAFTTPSVTSFSERTRAYMKIEDGCERYCTYCIIPSARGFVRSKPLGEIEKEARALYENGFSEIVLVGINLTSYGKETGLNIADAVEACAKSGIPRIRLGSIEPDCISDGILTRLSEVPAFCPQFHLSLQSGSDGVLKRMNRRYDTAFYRDLVLRIRKVFENAAITTDVMVGFAGETAEEHRESLNFVTEIGFAKCHVFAYSRRKGTFAYNMPGQIEKAEKSRRSAEMIKAAAEAEDKFLDREIGKTAEVLFESYDGTFAFGYSENYTRVKLKSENSLGGQIKKVTLVSRDGETLTAE